MNKVIAWLLLAACVSSGIGWTVWVRVRMADDYWTTSRCLQRLTVACPAVAVLLVLVAVHVIQDAMPGVDRWLVLLAFVAAFCLGHAIWPL